MYLFAFLLLSIGGAALLYLSRERQACLPQPLHPRRSGIIYMLMQVLALLAVWQQWSLLCGLCAWLVLSMLSFSCLPFMSLLIDQRAEKS